MERFLKPGVVVPTCDGASVLLIGPAKPSGWWARQRVELPIVVPGVGIVQDRNFQTITKPYDKYPRVAVCAKRCRVERHVRILE